MNHLKMAENITYLRRKRGITQEALAEFLGVTKASVSKWETGQSLPDILLLPRLASYFDISIDELMGYQAQLTQDEIRRQYHRFAADFASRDFKEVLKETQDFVKQYYSCYPALTQIIILWLNHYMLAASEEEQKAILKEIVVLCRHIEEQCADMRLCGNVAVFQALANLLLGDAREVIRILEPQHDPKRMTGQAEGILIQAYQKAGELKKAEAFNQYILYYHLLAMLNDSITYLASQMQDETRAKETIKRIEELIRIYQADILHPNTVLQFYLQKAMFYSIHGDTKEALEALKKYIAVGEPFIKNGCSLRQDEYFDQIGVYFEDLDLGMQAPRDIQVIWDSFRQILGHPAFALLERNQEFQKMKKELDMQSRTTEEAGQDRK